MAPLHSSTPRTAFSLVELSIVLVILGLLVGGILSGKSLIKASELRKVVSQRDSYRSAIQTFRDKYFMLPGDINNATQFWGIAGGTGSDGACRPVATTDGRTCNGNGDGMVYVTAGSYEYGRLWQHLANANLVAGYYNGAAGFTASPTSMRGTNWTAVSWGVISAGGAGGLMFVGAYNGTLSVGVFLGADMAIPFTPQEAWNIDIKADDGKPATGSAVIYAANGFENCTDAPAGPASNTLYSASYLLTSDAVECALMFRNQF